MIGKGLVGIPSAGFRCGRPLTQSWGANIEVHGLPRIKRTLNQILSEILFE